MVVQNSKLEIIDFERKGNVIRFYLGTKGDWGWVNPNSIMYKNADESFRNALIKAKQYYGDDWNDYPYQHNAGKVYDAFIWGYTDYSVPFDCIVLEPQDTYSNAEYSKDDMIERKVPCIIIVPEYLADECLEHTFDYWLERDDVNKIYFGDVFRGSHNVYFNEGFLL